MTVYGDLDVSVIDQLPPGRKPYRRCCNTTTAGPNSMPPMRKQLQMGRQAYIVYPLIQERREERPEKPRRGL